MQAKVELFTEDMDLARYQAAGRDPIVFFHTRN